MIVKSTGRYRLEKSNIGHCDQTEKTIQLLKAGPPQTFENYLHDHVVIFSISHGHPMHESCRKFFKFCFNCTFFTTNTYKWLHDYTKYSAKPWLSIPYSSAWHIRTEDYPPIYPWISNHRPYLVSFVGSLQTDSAHSNKLRARFIQQCNNTKLKDGVMWGKKPLCRVVTPQGEGRAAGIISKFTDVYRSSIFCLCPPGKTMNLCISMHVCVCV